MKRNLIDFRYFGNRGPHLSDPIFQKIPELSLESIFQRFFVFFLYFCLPFPPPPRSHSWRNFFFIYFCDFLVLKIKKRVCRKKKFFGFFFCIFVSHFAPGRHSWRQKKCFVISFSLRISTFFFTFSDFFFLKSEF